MEVTEEARVNIEQQYSWIAERDAEAAEHWLNGLESAISSLATLPGRCPLAVEGQAFQLPIRQLLYGKARRRFRILFLIEEGRVTVLHVRHYRKDLLRPDPQ